MKLLFPILLIGIAVASFFLYIDPQYTEIQSLQVKISQYDKILETSTEVTKQKNLLKEEDKKIMARNDGRDDERLRKIVPRRIETIKFILDMNHLAVEERLSVKNIVVGADTKAGGDSAKSKLTPTRSYRPTNFSFSVSTSYESFLRFLETLEKNLEIMDIASITFNSSDNNYYDFSVSGVVYSIE